MDERILLQKVKARSHGVLVADMATEEAAGFDSQEVKDVFWAAIRHRVDQKSPLPPAPPVAAAVRPMTGDETKAFESQKIRWGLHKDSTIGQVMSTTDGRKYLRWMADQTFVDELRRYLENDSVKKEYE